MTTFSSDPPPLSSSPQRGDESDIDMRDRRSMSSRRSSQAPRSPNVRGAIQPRRRQVALPTDIEDSDSMISGQNGSSENRLIWGTNINTESSIRRFKRFVSQFTKDNTRIYPDLIADALDAETFNVNIDMQNVNEFDSEMYKEIISYPSECLPLLDLAVNEYAETHYQDLTSINSSEIWCRPFNLLTVKSMRDMDPSDIDKLIAIRGMVIRCTNTIPDIQVAFFRCILCNHEVESMIQAGRIEEPVKCPNQSCQGSNSMELIHNRCKFQDKQLVKVQETPDAIPEGETPQTIDMYVYDNLVDICKPGDRIELTGVYRASAIRNNPRRRQIESVYKTYVDCIHIRKSKQTQLSVEDSKAEEGSIYHTSFDSEDESELRREERELKLIELGKDPNIYDKLINSLAPSVFEMESVKKGLLCQLFGSAPKDFSSVGGGKFRSQMNVLLCGDPGTSKSQLLTYVHKIAPRGIYTSGKGSSAVGLTAYISKDHDTGDLVLESGALVLSDRGICCIDEFDKMSESARSILHEVMEGQTVSIAKAGIICTLNARTSILAAANPIESRYNPTKSVIENIDLPPTLMSRFDLIYLILDRPNEKNDKMLAKHLVSMYYNERDQVTRDDILDQKTLMDYISYSRREINPTLSNNAVETLIEGYLELRGMGRVSGRKVITATPRQLESLIRISEALARMRHSTIVSENDVEEALMLHKTATLAAATDPQTGAINLDMINVGFSNEESNEIKKQAVNILEILRNQRGSVIKVSKLLRRYNQPLSEKDHLGISQLKKVIERLEDAQKVRSGDWLRHDPTITILDTTDL